jgi:hypothetical protein
MIDARHRIVCHTCGNIFPEGTVGKHDCLPGCEADLHIHDISKPCALCVAAVTPEECAQLAKMFEHEDEEHLVIEREIHTVLQELLAKVKKGK